MKVDDLRMLDEEGDALQVSGVLGLRRLAFGDVQMHAQAQRFGFVRNDLARLEVDLDLDVTGQVTRPTIAGTAAIESRPHRGGPHPRLAGPQPRTDRAGRRRPRRRQGAEARPRCRRRCRRR